MGANGGRVIRFRRGARRPPNWDLGTPPQRRKRQRRKRLLKGGLVVAGIVVFADLVQSGS